MSSLFTQITQQAQQQRALLEHAPETNPDSSTPQDAAPLRRLQTAATTVPPVAPSNDSGTDKSVTPPTGTTVPHSGTTIYRAGAKTGERAGKGSRIDLDKLKTIIEELSVMPASSNGLNVRMSQQEMADIDEFIYDRLRREGLKGYQVSIAKLMRYSMRYMFRVHPDEFVIALRAALQVEETLSI